jgi:hypothetical protein
MTRGPPHRSFRPLRRLPLTWSIALKVEFQVRELSVTDQCLFQSPTELARALKWAGVGILHSPRQRPLKTRNLPIEPIGFSAHGCSQPRRSIVPMAELPKQPRDRNRRARRDTMQSHVIGHGTTRARGSTPSNGATDVGLIVDATVIAAEMVIRTLVGRRTKWPRNYLAGQANGDVVGEMARAIICAIARIDRRISVPVAFIVCWSVILFLGWELANAFASSTTIYVYAINCGVIATVIVFFGLADTLASELVLNPASRIPRDIRWLSVSTSGVPPLAGNMTTLRGAGVLLARIGDANEPQE